MKAVFVAGGHLILSGVFFQKATMTVAFRLVTLPSSHGRSFGKHNGKKMCSLRVLLKGVLICKQITIFFPIGCMH